MWLGIKFCSRLFELGNEPLDFVKGGRLLDDVSDC
jgi:hypothetical protein